MNEDTIALIERLANALGQNADAIVSTYTSYYAVTAISWMCMGVLLIGIFLYKPVWESDKFWDPYVRTIAKFFLLVFAAMFILANVGDLIVPEAVAMDRLISSITP